MRRLAGIALVVIVALGALAFLSRSLVPEKLALKRGADAYLVGYPLVTMAATRDALLSVPGAQVNAFSHVRYLPDGDTGVYVVTPNRDTYYSSAWLDLRGGPLLIQQPDMGQAFWLLPVLDAWTNVVADPGTRTLGNAPHKIVIAGPDWQGAAPADAELYRSPTSWAWAILRIEAGGDTAALQDGFRIAPLSDPTRYWQPAVYTSPREAVDVKAEVDGLSGEQFFTRLAQALQDTAIEPDAADQLARIGVTAGTFTAPTGAAARGLAQVPARVQEGMSEALRSDDATTVINGWRVPPMILGAYGTEYPTRAVVAREGLGANLPADAVYASTTVAADGNALEGGRTYRIEMPADVPVRAFWSISLYDERGNFLPGGTQGLSVSGRGGQPARTVTISAQRAPGRWLRAPESGRFRLLMRLYWPEQQVLDNQWQFPPVTPGS